MPRIIVCNSAKEAAEFCHAEAQLHRPRRHVPHGGSRKQGKRGQKKRGQNNDKHRRSRSKPAIPQSRTPSKRKERDIQVAPIHGDHVLLGDSIMVRYSREAGLFAPKDMALCKGGNTIAHVLQGVKAMKSDFDRGTVVLLVGTNNVLQRKPITAEDFNNLIISIKGKGVSKIYIMTVPPIKDADVKSVNSIIKGLENPGDGVHVVDTHSVFWNELTNTRKDSLFEKFYANNQRGIKVDMVHPNKEGLRAMRRALEDSIMRQMEESDQAS